MAMLCGAPSWLSKAIVKAVPAVTLTCGVANVMSLATIVTASPAGRRPWSRPGWPGSGRRGAGAGGQDGGQRDAGRGRGSGASCRGLLVGFG